VAPGPHAGGVGTPQQPASSLCSIDLGGQILIEDDDLIIVAGKSLWTPDEETDITVQVEIGASRIDFIPPPLVDLARSGGGMSHGAFIGVRHR
jgi:hypothetical protein